MSADVVLRRASPADAEGLARLVLEGFETFRAFAAEGWESPPLEVEPPVADPRLADLWQLFVRPAQQGTGLAATLLAAAVREAAERSHATMRLVTPAAHARARRPYEREGFRPEGDPFADPDLGMSLVELRRGLCR
ncbi:MAG: GNAT family N-acetyltransferase [Actinomycetota bacterium]|nr:GNAT family N-acetyltransferase [Actinomycetota bacterium]